MERSQPASDQASLLASLLSEPVVVADVGCRWGFADDWARLGDRSRLLGFEPDREECARLRERYADTPQVTVVPAALGSRVGPATLYVTKDPSGNSLLPTLDDVIERHPGFDGGQVERTVEVDLTTLDTWCASSGVERIDVIKIDTQGSELGVLEGAVGILGTVRAIEVEVEFNPMYEEAVVFGDIDRFLRARGFELWRLRDLAHYAQYGADRGWGSLEALHFDTTVVRYHARAGQLFWANAFYLHRDVTHPTVAAGWQSLVRDACLTSVLGFHDLAGVALDRAVEAAPPDVAAVLRTARADELASGRRRLEEAEGAAVLQGTLLLEVDDPSFLGSGWQPPQRVELGPVRWTGPAREASVDLPVVLPAGSRVDILVIGALSQAILDQLALEVNRRPVALTQSPHEHGVVFTGRLPQDYVSKRDFTRLVVRTVETIPWCEHHPDSTDDIELGVAVSWVRVTAPSVQ